jgi:flagellar biosynthesis protein FlhB
MSVVTPLAADARTVPVLKPRGGPEVRARSRTRLSGPYAKIDLQWFAAEDEGRTEEPSEYKIRKAREEGRVAKSTELVQAVVLLLPMLTIALLSGYLLNTLLEMMTFFFTRSIELDPTKDAIIAQAFFNFLLKLTLPIVGVAFVAALFSNIVQTGFLFTVKPITPDFSRIVPKFGQYFKRTLFSTEALFNLAKSIIKMAIIGFIAFLTIKGEIKKLAGLMLAPFWSSVTFIAGLVVRIIVECAIAFLALAVIDYLFQRRQFMESLKMTKQEVIEERKMFEGDPQIKSRLQQRMRELLSRNMAQNVPKADVVVTNPTHFAVALEWNRSTMAAPTVTAKGADEMAQAIKKIARDNDVPIIENRPLARALYAEVEIGDAIPEKYYSAIAAILAQVYRMNDTAERVASDLTGA